MLEVTTVLCPPAPVQLLAYLLPQRLPPATRRVGIAPRPHSRTRRAGLGVPLCRTWLKKRNRQQQQAEEDPAMLPGRLLAPSLDLTHHLGLAQATKALLQPPRPPNPTPAGSANHQTPSVDPSSS